MQKMLSYVRRAVDQYHMIEDGDVIAVGVSGGKDSLALLATLANLRRFYPKKFELKAITLEMGYEEMDFTPVAELCKKLDVEYITRQTDIKTIVFDIRQEENPCSLCAKMRRGALNDTAKQCGCNKVALGHHQDDVIVTFLMNLTYEGSLHSITPSMPMRHYPLTVIRPLYLAPEPLIRELAVSLGLAKQKTPCPYETATKRDAMTQVFETLQRHNAEARYSIWSALRGREGGADPHDAD